MYSGASLLTLLLVVACNDDDLLQYFDTVGFCLLTCKNRLSYNLYCVGGDVKHYSIQSNKLNKVLCI